MTSVAAAWGTAAGDREALSGSLDRIQRAASVILKAVSVGG
jgi:hypothetical protein